MSKSSIELNPFPAAAVARLSTSEDEFLSIETEALKQARTLLRDYLTRASREQQQTVKNDTQGIVLAIVGDYGTGKTHIAQDMLRQIAAEGNPNLHPLYLDAPSDTFLALYKERFLRKLDRNTVLRRVDEYYADIVADELIKSKLTRPVAEALRKREISPDEVVRNFGLIESKFVRALAKKLKAVTEQSDFGTALLLLRRPEFQAAVWEWFEGAAPDPILEERGIRRRIDDDAAALEALGVMAFLFGQQHHRFILFIDEIEKVLSHTAAHRPEESAILALKKLMESMSKTRALLVLIGLPEFQDFLPEDARQRITAVIRPSDVTANEIAEYVREANRRAGKKDSLEPFTLDSIDYLSEIAGGNSRKMVRLCYHAYHLASNSNSNVTRAMLREIAREQFEATRTEDVTADVGRLLDARGWLYETNKIFTIKKSKLKIDYWLPVGDDGKGIAVWMTRSVLQESDVTALTKDANTIAISNSATPVHKVLVVNGYLADNLMPKLENTYERVIVYRLRTFREDLDSVISGMRSRLEQLDRENILATIKQRVDEISRQHSNIDKGLSSLLDKGFNRGDLQGVVLSTLRIFFGQLTGGSSASVSEANYPRVVAVFDQAEQILDQLITENDTIEFIFSLPAKGVSSMHRPSFVRSLNEYLHDRKFIDGFTYILLLKKACLAFRKSVFTVLDQAPGRISQFDEETAYDRNAIQSLCMTFDSLISRLDLPSTLRNMSLINSRVKSEFGFNIDRDTFELRESVRIERVNEQLMRLGPQVYDALDEDVRSKKR